MATVPPLKDLDLNVWGLDFVTKIAISPPLYGISVGDSTLITGYRSDYNTKLGVAKNPATRTAGTVAAKNDSKKQFRAKAAQLIKIIGATPTVTEQMRLDLGLNPKDLIPTPIAPPATRPQLTVEPSGVLELHDETTPSRRGKPFGVKGAVVYTKVLAQDAPAPTTPADAAFSILATKGRVALPIPANSNAKRLYVMAQWYNERGELGPVSTIAATTLAA